MKEIHVRQSLWNHSCATEQTQLMYQLKVLGPEELSHVGSYKGWLVRAAGFRTEQNFSYFNRRFKKYSSAEFHTPQIVGLISRRLPAPPVSWACPSSHPIKRPAPHPRQPGTVLLSDDSRLGFLKHDRMTLLRRLQRQRKEGPRVEGIAFLWGGRDFLNKIHRRAKTIKIGLSVYIKIQCHTKHTINKMEKIRKDGTRPLVIHVTK